MTVIDLRGLDNSQKNLQGLTTILNLVGQAEHYRQQRAQLANMSQLVQTGMPIEQAALTAQTMPVPKESGLTGALQGAAGLLMPIGSQKPQDTLTGQLLTGAVQRKIQRPYGYQQEHTEARTKGIEQATKTSAARERWYDSEAKKPPTIRTRPLDYYMKDGKKVSQLIPEPEYNQAVADILSQGGTLTAPKDNKGILTYYDENNVMRKELVDDENYNKRTTEIIDKGGSLEKQELTKKEELEATGYYTDAEIEQILRIRDGLLAKASSRKTPENMTPGEKMDFYQGMLTEAQGRYYGVEGGYAEPISPKVAEYAQGELDKLPMFKEKGTIRVKSPDGQVGTIPAEQWKEAQAEGYTKIE